MPIKFPSSGRMKAAKPRPAPKPEPLKTHNTFGVFDSDGEDITDQPEKWKTAEEGTPLLQIDVQFGNDDSVLSDLPDNWNDKNPYRNHVGIRIDVEKTVECSYEPERVTKKDVNHYNYEHPSKEETDRKKSNKCKDKRKSSDRKKKKKQKEAALKQIEEERKKLEKKLTELIAEGEHLEVTVEQKREQLRKLVRERISDEGLQSNKKLVDFTNREIERGIAELLIRIPRTADEWIDFVQHRHPCFHFCVRGDENVPVVLLVQQLKNMIKLEASTKSNPSILEEELSEEIGKAFGKAVAPVMNAAQAGTEDYNPFRHATPRPLPPLPNKLPTSVTWSVAPLREPPKPPPYRKPQQDLPPPPPYILTSPEDLSSQQNNSLQKSKGQLVSVSGNIQTSPEMARNKKRSKKPTRVGPATSRDAEVKDPVSTFAHLDLSEMTSAEAFAHIEWLLEQCRSASAETEKVPVLPSIATTVCSAADTVKDTPSSAEAKDTNSKEYTGSPKCIEAERFVGEFFDRFFGDGSWRNAKEEEKKEKKKKEKSRQVLELQNPKPLGVHDGHVYKGLSIVQIVLRDDLYPLYTLESRPSPRKVRAIFFPLGRDKHAWPRWVWVDNRCPVVPPGRKTDFYTPYIPESVTNSVCITFNPVRKNIGALEHHLEVRFQKAPPGDKDGDLAKIFNYTLALTHDSKGALWMGPVLIKKRKHRMAAREVENVGFIEYTDMNIEDVQDIADFMSVVKMTNAHGWPQDNEERIRRAKEAY